MNVVSWRVSITLTWHRSSGTAFWLSCVFVGKNKTPRKERIEEGSSNNLQLALILAVQTLEYITLYPLSTTCRLSLCCTFHSLNSRHVAASLQQWVCCFDEEFSKAFSGGFVQISHMRLDKWQGSVATDVFSWSRFFEMLWAQAAAYILSLQLHEAEVTERAG